MSKIKILNHHNKWMKKGIMKRNPTAQLSGGLCSTIIKRSPLFDLLIPMSSDSYVSTWWGVTPDECRIMSVKELQTKYTPLRQTIVLFMAAMNGEL